MSVWVDCGQVWQEGSSSEQWPSSGAVGSCPEVEKRARACSRLAVLEVLETAAAAAAAGGPRHYVEIE